MHSEQKLCLHFKLRGLDFLSRQIGQTSVKNKSYDNKLCGVYTYSCYTPFKDSISEPEVISQTYIQTEASDI